MLPCRDVEPGKLHDLRSASVNNTRLAIVAVWMKLHPFLRYFSPRLFGEIASFVQSVKEAKKGQWQSLRNRSYSRRMVQVSNVLRTLLGQHTACVVRYSCSVLILLLGLDTLQAAMTAVAGNNS